MEDRASIKRRTFDDSDKTIHRLAATILLGSYDSDFILTQGKYAYQVKGGSSGYLRYKKGNSAKWVSIADWCFYGLYIVIRYRKPVWLRPMYRSLFNQMNFTSVTFGDSSIELVGTDGETLQGRRLHLCPPHAFEEVMTSKFGYSQQKAEVLKTKLGFAI